MIAEKHVSPDGRITDRFANPLYEPSSSVARSGGPFGTPVIKNEQRSQSTSSKLIYGPYHSPTASKTRKTSNIIEINSDDDSDVIDMTATPEKNVLKEIKVDPNLPPKRLNLEASLSNQIQPRTVQHLETSSSNQIQPRTVQPTPATPQTHGRGPGGRVIPPLLSPKDLLKQHVQSQRMAEVNAMVQAVGANANLSDDDDDLDINIDARDPLTEAQAQTELKNLLENVQHAEVTPIENRLPTPVDLKITLLEHQKLGLEWMVKMEQGTNKGGILADDMVFRPLT
jgi:SNF2 family DNA or RNA helicase